MKTLTDEEINAEAWRLYPNTNRTTHRDNFKKGAKWHRSQIEDQTEQWIDVNERLPEIGQQVAVYRDIDSKQIYVTFWSQEEERYSKWNEITHWKPIQPPTERKEEKK